MKLLISYPAAGTQKVVNFEDDRQVRTLMDKRMAEEVEADFIGDEWKGYVLKITGGQDKQGFPMKQGVLLNGRCRLLLSRGTIGMVAWRFRDGTRRRRSVRGCIVGPDLAVVTLVVVKKGEQEIAGFTDAVQPRLLGPKRASKIRKLFNLSKEDDVRRYVIKTTVTKTNKKGKSRKVVKAPKIQRLCTPAKLAKRRAAKKADSLRRMTRVSQKRVYNIVVNQRTAAIKSAVKARQDKLATRRANWSARLATIKANRAAGIKKAEKVVSKKTVSKK